MPSLCPRCNNQSVIDRNQLRRHLERNAEMPDPSIQPFQIDVPDATLRDLSDRLAHSRIPKLRVTDGGEDAANQDEIERLVRYWRTEYDWRKEEQRLSDVPQYRVIIDGVGIHFVHVPGVGPNPLPLMLTNGWPSSFVEYLQILGPLTDPAAYSGDPNDAFSVIAPALPGYGFSDRCLDRSIDRPSIAGLFARLMTEVLGYPAFVAHGDDIGGGVVSRLGVMAVKGLLAIQSANPMDPPLGPDAEPLSDEETAFVAASNEWDQTEGAYSHVQRTRPQTLAYGLNDSPLGLAAWILEKFLAWSDPATRSQFRADDLVTNVMIYWVTETIASSVRLYALRWPPLAPTETVKVPSFVIHPKESRLPPPPETWLRRGYPHLQRYTILDRGGHFLALENPSRLVSEIRDAFRPFRGITDQREANLHDTAVSRVLRDGSTK